MTAIPVKVAVRCRPLTQKEVDQGDLLCVHFPSNAPMIVIGNKPFTFNYVFEPEVSQESIYEETVAPLVNNILKGYNATVFAYGQTGSGKTYTMGGDNNGIKIENTTGIIPRVLFDLFNKFAEKDTHNFNVTVSYLEIYNEEVRDLLNINGKDSLNVRDANGIKIPGLTEMIVDDYSSTMKYFESGMLARSVGSTAMNMESSRSHAIFTLQVDITNKSDQTECTKARLNLVDLAGSEKLKKTQASGRTRKEGININKSLLCLGNVISSLGEDSRHIPYRDSKLTRLLQDSLGGNSYTLMIACISPADSNMSESLNTLRYADRASKIKNKPLVNHDPKVAEIINLKHQVNQLQMELIRITGGQTNNNESYQELTKRTKELEQQNDNLTKELHASLEQNAVQVEKIIQLETLCDEQKTQLESVLELYKKIEKKQDELESLKENFESLKNMSNKKELESRENLNVEIQNLKSQRVKLMKQMKEDKYSFRKGKLQNDKEVNKLSQEASAATNFEGSKVTQSLQVMIEREIDVKVSLQETKHYLESLISDRALLHSQVKELNAELNETPKKKKATDNNSMNGNDSFKVKEIKDRLKALHEDIRIINIQITDLQGKIQDEESDKSTPCWEALHSMNEAKIILRSLFEKTVTEKVRALLVEGEIKKKEKKITELKIKNKKDLYDPSDSSLSFDSEEWKTPHKKKTKKRSCKCKTGCRQNKCGCLKSSRICGPKCGCLGICQKKKSMAPGRVNAKEP